MAQYYWVGGSTATSGSYTNSLGTFTSQTGTANMNWVLAFDWNNPKNWYQSYEFGNSAAHCIVYWQASDCPSVGDIAIFGASNIDFGNYPGYTLPSKAIAPCLWGGASQSGITITWLGGTGSGSTETGTTYNSALNTLWIQSMNRSDSHYPFAYIGYGQGLDAIAYGSSDYSPLYDAQAKGFTLDLSVWGGTSWEDLANAVAATGGTERLQQLRLKVSQILTDGNNTNSPVGAISPTTKNQGVVDITTIKSIARLNGSSAGSATDYVNTTAFLNGTVNYRLGGNFMRIDRSVPFGDAASQAAWQQSGFFYTTPRNHLELNGVIAGRVNVTGYIGTVSADYTSNIAEMRIDPLLTYTFMNLGNDFSREYVMSQIGNYGITAGGNTGQSENLIITSPLVTVSGGGYAGERVGVVLGAAGATAVGNNYRIGMSTIGSIPKIPVKFAGDVAVNKIYANNCIISADQGIPSNGTLVKVGELHLASNSTLDLAAVPAFDGWRFGVQSGYAINGGIMFDDETCRMKGSQGVKLWNDTILINGSQFMGDSSARDGAKSSYNSDVVSFINNGN
jgi:hypothetical protein